jgi:EAL domain-containing protein (putative c-di-GMP-specific phosphodiesterase class I)
MSASRSACGRWPASRWRAAISASCSASASSHTWSGLLGPLTLLPAIEAADAGLLDGLTLTLLGRLLRRARAWPGRKVLSVNIAPQQLGSRGFMVTLLEVVAQARYPVEQLKLELLEQGGLDISAAAVNAKMLVGEGIDLWLTWPGSRCRRTTARRC